jgi:hypothetical protein
LVLIPHQSDRASPKALKLVYHIIRLMPNLFYPLQRQERLHFCTNQGFSPT